ncbi:low-temperature viability protein ltv1 [Niveomyces insectorum RCEF 264]|uniref:Low-temperature viability protein ltv1 n=1 Tax=Niveomyces insectorum RCEF 264 TaxID=1081102 RepID=A0A167M5U9_9HYPO|nr:low-temperature viability protein ltv1 [Niveomyces insectorum RCEF 264]
MVLNPALAPNGSKSKHLAELASQLGPEIQNIRPNEGEAADYGVYFDDTKYDYMQHLREIGAAGGESVFVESTVTLDKDKNKGKQRQSLADALHTMELRDGRSSKLLDEDILPSKRLQKVTYQNQQDVPDAIAGFQPDMDPRLREVLEALEDEAYVDDDDAGIFEQLAKDGKEVDPYEFETTYSEADLDKFSDDDGWESDATEKPSKTECSELRTQRSGDDSKIPKLVEVHSVAEITALDGEGQPSSNAWLEDFKKFKRDQATTRKLIVPALSEIQSSIWTTTTNGGRKKKRKGALTNQSGVSMTSSSLVRTEQLTLLDARFDKIDEEYNEDMADDLLSVSALSSASSVQGSLRTDFDNIMDDFLVGYSMQGQRSIKKGRQQGGLEQLEEIRRGLGPARLSTLRK